jgi:hypothetical protein
MIKRKLAISIVGISMLTAIIFGTLIYKVFRPSPLNSSAGERHHHHVKQ